MRGRGSVCLHGNAPNCGGQEPARVLTEAPVWAKLHLVDRNGLPLSIVAQVDKSVAG